jgi:hypothetical protein
MTYRLRVNLASWCVSLSLWAISLSAQQPVFQTYGPVDRGLFGVTAGPDGNVWVCAVVAVR